MHATIRSLSIWIPLWLACAACWLHESKPFFHSLMTTRSYSCALVDWFELDGNEPDTITGFWRVKPEIRDGLQSVGVVDINSVVRAVHLIGVYQDTVIPSDLAFYHSLDAFEVFISINTLTTIHMRPLYNIYVYINVAIFIIFILDCLIWGDSPERADSAGANCQQCQPFHYIPRS